MRIQYLFSSRHTRILKSGNRHKKSVFGVIKDVIKISDVVLIVLDARFIEKSRNEEVEKEILSADKRIIYIINKVDLVNLEELKKNPILEQIKPYVLFSCKSHLGRGELRERIKIEAKRGLKGKKFKIAHIGLVGYPNTGKSSLINILVGRNAVTASSESGYTQGMHKIRFAKNILILDSPGVIPSKEDNLEVSSLKKQAEINARNATKANNPEFIVHTLMQDHPNLFERYYNIEARGDAEILLEELGNRHKFLLKKGAIDTDRTSRLILKDWQEGKIRK
jgi:ribosome biogenesis GTPase A